MVVTLCNISEEMCSLLLYKLCETVLTPAEGEPKLEGVLGISVRWISLGVTQATGGSLKIVIAKV